MHKVRTVLYKLEPLLTVTVCKTKFLDLEGPYIMVQYLRSTKQVQYLLKCKLVLTKFLDPQFPHPLQGGGTCICCVLQPSSAIKILSEFFII